MPRLDFQASQVEPAITDSIQDAVRKSLSRGNGDEPRYKSAF